MPLANNDFSNGKEVYFTEAFKTMVRSERELLLRQTTEQPIKSPSDLHAYRYDIYRLLRTYKVPSYLWWVTAYLNGIEDPFADISGLSSIRMISEQALSDRIVRSNTTRA